MTGRLLLVRHGITDWNREGRFQGHLDPPLSAAGRREAELVGERLRSSDGYLPARIACSPLRRAVETAELLGTEAPITLDTRLIEIGQGEWEGRTHGELRRSDAARYAEWRARAGAAIPPGGEPLTNAFERVSDALDAALALPGWPLLVVAHGGIMRLLARHLLRIDHERAWGLDVSNASLSVLHPPDKTGQPAWGVERWNDVQHLIAAEGAEPERASRDRSEEGEPLAL